MAHTGRRIVILDGHPDASGQHFVHALASAYEQGARDASREVRRIAIGALDFPLLRANADFLEGEPPGVIREAQEAIAWADHLVVIFPLWLGAMPAVLKGFLEQVMRPGFAFEARKRGLPAKLLAGRSARLVVTMGMPAFFYRWYYRAHSLKSLERNILRFCGVSPVRATVIGGVETIGGQGRERWLAKLAALGGRGA